MLVRARPFIQPRDIVRLLSEQTEANEQHVLDFEREFSKNVGIAQCYAVDSGRTALFFALKCIGLTRDDEVIVPSLICSVVVEVVLQFGAVPVLADSGPDDFNLLPKDVSSKVTPRTKAIILAHLYGMPCDLYEICEIADAHSIYLIEDCAHGIAATYDGKKIGSYGDASIFSFNFDKPFSTGSGGVLAVNNPALSEYAQTIVLGSPRMTLQDETVILQALVLQHYLTDERFYTSFLAFDFASDLLRTSSRLVVQARNALVDGELLRFENEVVGQISKRKGQLRWVGKLYKLMRRQSATGPLRMNALRAQVGILCLRNFETVEARRRENANYFCSTLEHLDSFILPATPNIKKPSFLRYTIINKSRYSSQTILQKSLEAGLEIGNFNWPKPIHLYPKYQRRTLNDRRSLKNSERLTRSLIQLPTHYYVDEKHRNQIAEVLSYF